MSLVECTWPCAKAGEALEALARAAKMPVEAMKVPATELDIRARPLEWEQWLDAAAAWLGLEVEPTPLSGDCIREEVEAVGPALLRVSIGGQDCLVGLLNATSKKVRLVDAGGDVRAVPTSELVDALSAPLRAKIAPKLQNLGQVVAQVGFHGPRASRLLERVQDKELAEHRLHQVCWMLRLAGHRSFGQALRRAGVVRMIATVAGLHFVSQSLFLSSWALLGRSVMTGSLEVAWLVAAALVLLTVLPLKSLVAWLQGKLGVTVGLLLKRRMLYGALRYDINALRQQSIGDLLGRVMESEQLQGVALSAALGTVLSIVNCAVALGVLSFAPGGGRFILSYLLVMLVTVFLVRERHVRSERWTQSRVQMTELLLERMLGHRTRLVQARPEQLHQDEDAALQQYVRRGRAADFISSILVAVMPRVWMLIGIGLVLVDFVRDVVTPVEIAIGVAGTMLGYRALASVTGAIAAVSSAVIAWRNIRPMYEAANREVQLGSCEAAELVRSRSRDERGPVVELRNMTYRYPGRAEPVFSDCNLSFHRGDQVLIEGKSGAGKSTLGSIVAGLRDPASGTLMLRGLDMQTLGENLWRRHVVSVPQFQENHVFTESLAFNLLMGRRWPPTTRDLQDAYAMCRRLGLEKLLEKMPSGIHQVVGESGWRLSHGEKSRVFIARALLQNPDVVVYDESFGALDPKNALECMRVSFERSPTSILIAHP